jgi:hypothetical protein
MFFGQLPSRGQGILAIHLQINGDNGKGFGKKSVGVEYGAERSQNEREPENGFSEHIASSPSFATPGVQDVDRNSVVGSLRNMRNFQRKVKGGQLNEKGSSAKLPRYGTSTKM